MITQDLGAVDLDAKWTPERRVGRLGTPRGLHHLATLARAVATNLCGSLEETTPAVSSYKDDAPESRRPISCGPELR